MVQLSQGRGVLWERINELKEQLSNVDGAVLHHTEGMEEQFPTKHYMKDGLYTREVFMPKGSFVISFIHKQNHPSFFLSGEMSILDDKGNIKRIKAPMHVQTEVGTQRVAYMHEDCTWVCVYKTDAKSVEDADKEVYTEDFNNLPKYIITKNKLCLQ